MAAPGQPVYAGQPARSPWYLSRVCMVIAMVMFFFAALTAGGADIVNAPAWEWGFAGFAAWVAAGALP